MRARGSNTFQSIRNQTPVLSDSVVQRMSHKVRRRDPGTSPLVIFPYPDPTGKTSPPGLTDTFGFHKMDLASPLVFNRDRLAFKAVRGIRGRSFILIYQIFLGITNPHHTICPEWPETHCCCPVPSGTIRFGSTHGVFRNGPGNRRRYRYSITGT